VKCVNAATEAQINSLIKEYETSYKFPSTLRRNASLRVAIREAARILRTFGVRRVRVGATHAVFSGSALQRLQEAELDELVVTDTVPIPAEIQEGVPALKILSTAPMFGDAILRIHGGRSISEMMEA